MPGLVGTQLNVMSWKTEKDYRKLEYGGEEKRILR